jgi:hypothetical protein
MWFPGSKRTKDERILSDAEASAGFLKPLLGSDFKNRFKARLGRAASLRRVS